MPSLMLVLASTKVVPVRRRHGSMAPDMELHLIALALDALAPGAGPGLSHALDVFAPTRLPVGASWWRRLRMLPTWLRQARERAAAIDAFAHTHRGLSRPRADFVAPLASLLARARSAARAEVHQYAAQQVGLRWWMG